MCLLLDQIFGSRAIFNAPELYLNALQCTIGLVE